MQVAGGIVVDGYGDVHEILDVLMNRAHRRDLSVQEKVPDVGPALWVQPDARALAYFRAVHEDAIHAGHVQRGEGICRPRRVGLRLKQRAMQPREVFGAEAFGSLDNCARPLVGCACFVALVVGEAANAEHHQLVDLGCVEGIRFALRRDGRKVVENYRRR